MNTPTVQARSTDDIRRRHLETTPGSSNILNDVDQNGQANSQLHARRNRRREHGPSQSIMRASIAFMIICAFYIVIAFFVHSRLNSYPEAKLQASSRVSEFLEENARAHLELITGLGPRVAGSEANIEAEHYIVHTINRIKKEAVPHHKIDLDVQRVSSGFTLDFINVGIGEFTSVYQNLSNIIVKLSPFQDAQDSVMVNCHYDSVIDSPGAGDDAASCCVMLEMLRAMSQNPDIKLMHNIIFLFNSAEENILQTSHGFITQHPWASSIKAFVNLDSAGAGGWELVFQTGPEHPWLVRTYAEAAPHPHASCIGQEIFQTGLIPSDTDYRIFRDYGHIPGLDIAHIKNGYVYHTRNDQAHHIPEGCMQRGGENVMAILLQLASSSKLSNPGEDKHGSMVFFDFLGYFMVAYPQRMGQILNWATFFFVYLSFVKRLSKEREPGELLRLTIAGILSLVMTWMIIICTSLGMAAILGAAGRELSYYTHNLNIVWLFILPSVTTVIFFHLLLKKIMFKRTDSDTMALVMQESNLILWSLVLLAMTLAGLTSSYVPLMCILAPCLIYTVLELLGVKPSSLLYPLLGSLVPSLYATYICYMLFSFLIPIMGRRGSEGNPDFVIASLSSLLVLLCLPYHIAFVYTHKRVGQVIVVLIAVVTMGLTAILCTPAGFPYSGSPSVVSPQRALVVHFDRKFHTESGQVYKSDSGIWYMPVDRHNTKHLSDYAPNVIYHARQASCDGVYCGRPYLYPMLNLVDTQKTMDFPASHLNLERVNINLVKRQVLGGDAVRLHFAMRGPTHVTIFISERPQAHIIKWSFGHFIPVEVFTLPFMTETTYFVYYSHSGNTTWNFNIDVHVEGKKKLTGSLINMGFAGHYLHGINQVSEDLLSLEKELPQFISPVTWSATYDEYVF